MRGSQVMLTVYCDESGGDDRRVAAVAGYISDSRSWDVFQRHWQTLLSTHGIFRYLIDGGFSRPQLEHLDFSDEPHLPQKFIPLAFSKPQAG
jgi:hypothetical protein